ncbi:hypothetical protein EV421DRAFT_1736139 [Armillaria borealis]|uniref:Uncharacterized protein n=1 Tax=Armillaria borealis TaxID=47425 RepID=A0AA39JH11_9AGAR|nr:hypothetical protein EV421DRAFT_1736139 [Armillaria borealis]
MQQPRHRLKTAGCRYRNLAPGRAYSDKRVWVERTVRVNARSSLTATFEVWKNDGDTNICFPSVSKIRTEPHCTRRASNVQIDDGHGLELGTNEYRPRCPKENPDRGVSVAFNMRGQTRPDTRCLLEVSIDLMFSLYGMLQWYREWKYKRNAPPSPSYICPHRYHPEEYIVHCCLQRKVDQLQSPVPKASLPVQDEAITMLFNLFNTMFTAVEFNVNTPQEHARIVECLKELLPTLWRVLGQQFTDESELDFVVYDLIDYGAKNNIAALFSNKCRLLGVVSWATTGTVANFKARASLHPAPYRAVGTNGLPDSIFVHDTFVDSVVEYTIDFVVQLIARVNRHKCPRLTINVGRYCYDGCIQGTT